MQKKCNLIDWRDRVEETGKRVENGARMTLEQLEHVLEDGRERDFLTKDPKTGCYSISQYVKTYSPIKVSKGDDQEQKPEGLLQPLIQNFETLEKLIKIHFEAHTYDKILHGILNKFKGIEVEQSAASAGEDASSNNTKVQDKDKQASQNIDSNYSQPRLQFEYLESLEEKGLQIKVEIDKFKEFQHKLKYIREVAEKCHELLASNVSGHDQVFRIPDEKVLNLVIQARKNFLNLNVISKDFIKFQSCFQPYIYWINKSVQLIKLYCRSLSLKQNQLVMWEPITDNEPDSDFSEKKAGHNPFDRESDFKSLSTLCKELQELDEQQEPPVDSQQICDIGKFVFFKDTQQGKYLLQIMERTNALINEFTKMKE